MSNIKKLLEGTEVEWKSLGEVGEFIRGNGLQKSDFTETGFPAIHYGQIYTYYGNFADKTKTFVSSELATKLKKAKKNDLIIATTSENIEDVCKPLVWLGDNEVCVSGETYIFRHNQNAKYIAYYLQMPIFFDYKKLNRTGTKVIRVHGDKLAKFQIPIPPLHIQSEIVRILDNFTELTAELTAELYARKKQYQFYQKKLLKFNNMVQIPITELCTIKARIGWQGLTRKEYLSNGDYYLVTGVDFTTDHHIDFKNCHYVTKERYNQDTNIQIHKGDLLITKDGTLGKIAIIDKEPDKPTTLNSGVFVLRIKDQSIFLRFLYHYLISDYFTKFIETVKTGSTVPHLTQNGLVNFQIPIPSPAQQEKIVSILDKFDTLTSSISEGLPREIALRQRQYEYYRDLLLSFPREKK